MSDLEQKSALRMLSLMAVLLLLLGVAGVMVWPLASEFAATQLAPGLGMRDAAVVSFFLTVVTLVYLPLPPVTACWESCSLCWRAFSAFLL